MDINGLLMGYPLVNKQKAIEHGHRNSGFYHKNGWSFHSYVNVYQRVFLHMLGIIIPTDEVILFGGVGIPPTSMNLGPCLKSCSRCKCNIGFTCFFFKAYLEEKRTWTSTLWLYLFRVEHFFCVISCTYPFLLVNIF